MMNPYQGLRLGRDLKTIDLGVMVPLSTEGTTGGSEALFARILGDPSSRELLPCSTLKARVPSYHAEPWPPLSSHSMSWGGTPTRWA